MNATQIRNVLYRMPENDIYARIEGRLVTGYTSQTTFGHIKKLFPSVHAHIQRKPFIYGDSVVLHNPVYFAIAAEEQSQPAGFLVDYYTTKYADTLMEKSVYDPNQQVTVALHDLTTEPLEGLMYISASSDGVAKAQLAYQITQ